MDMRAPSAVFDWIMPSESTVRNELFRFQVASALLCWGILSTLDLRRASVAPVELMDSCRLRALDMLACLLRSSSVALYYFKRCDSCQLK